MNLIVTSPRRLQSAYGERAARLILRMLGRLGRARARRGIVSRLLAVEDGVPGLGVAGADGSADAITAQLRQIAALLAQGGSRLESVLLVGGPDIIPFHDLPNPTPTDGDASVPTDRPYSVSNTATLIPEWPTGRLPGAARNPTILLRLLQNTLLLHEQPSALPPKAFGYTTAAWAEASAAVFAVAGEGVLLQSPPAVAGAFDPALLHQARRVYCNLHGLPNAPIWYGQASTRPNLVAALRPADLANLDLRGAVVFSAACYGAAISGRTEQDALALTFLAQGAACFVGATAIAYGPATLPLGEADLLAFHFWEALGNAECSLGQAFTSGVQAMIASTIARQQVLDADDRKTALTFVLYGDPALIPG